MVFSENAGRSFTRLFGTDPAVPDDPGTDSGLKSLSSGGRAVPVVGQKY